MPKISVITCTHNPRTDYLEATVESLRHQSLPSHQWEYLLIDNASATEQRPAVDLSWHPDGKVIREETLGLTPARLRGIGEAQGELLVFVDDDNVLDSNYLEQAMKVAENHPFLGSWSGQCIPSFEQPPPEWTRRYWGNLALRQFDQDVWSNLPRLPETMPCGAGLCVRQEVARRYAHVQDTKQGGMQLDRTGDSLVSGGDNELAACACDLGLGVGLIASLRLTHLIPARRLTPDYLARLAEGIYFSAALLDYFRTGHNKDSRVGARELLRLCLTRQPHRKIYAASLRGRRKAYLWLKESGMNTVVPNS